MLVAKDVYVLAEDG